MKTSDPDLTDRVAACSCGEERPSSPSLAFFSFQGEGSDRATTQCAVCRYNKGVAVLHDPSCDEPIPPHLRRFDRHDFVPIGDVGHDTFYCGHGGWD